MKKIFLFIIFILLLSGCGNKISFTIEEDTINLKVGENYQISSSTNATNYNITYTSDNPVIATVNNTGLVYAVSGGDTKITVTLYYDKENISKTVNVHIVEDEIKNIIFSGEAILIKTAERIKINYSYEPSNINIEKKEIISSDNDIVGVENEDLIANKEGKASLMVILNGKYRKSINVFVRDNGVTDYIKLPESITASDIDMKTDEKKKIEYTVLPTDSYQEIDYEISNPSIIRIDNNQIIPLTSGNTNVTLKTVNGYSKTIKVNVTSSAVDVEKIIPSTNNVSIKVGSNFQLSATVNPANATDKSLQYTSSNPSIATVSNTGLINGIAEGNAVITIKSSNNKTANVVVLVSKNSSTGSGISCSRWTDKVGTIKPSLADAPTNETFNDCRRVSHNLRIFINGQEYGAKGYYTIKKGVQVSIEVKLPSVCGNVIRLTRTSASGQSNWREYVNQYSSPSVQRDNPSTYVNGATGYKWLITGIKTGCLIVSQTSQYDTQAPNGAKANMKSMITLNLRIID